ncbi:MAG: tetratricopeptide repeat protein [Verrucomicrobiota bacterium]|nr:tetratricopeptide repeat protein [Verrucomicrobiota bacterium]
MRKVFVLLFSLLIIPLGFSASEVQDVFQKANASYASGEFKKAGELYSQLISSGHGSFQIYYNAGNAWSQAGEPGHAILNYKRALTINSRDSKTLQNLDFAYTLGGIPAPPKTFIVSMSSNFTIRFWAYTTFGLFSVTCLLLATSLLTQKRLVWSGAFTFVLMLLTLTPYLVLKSTIKDAVVLKPSSMRVSPIATAALTTSLKSGEIVSIKSQFGNFFLVESGDNSGWLIFSDEVEPIFVIQKLPKNSWRD